MRTGFNQCLNVGNLMSEFRVEDQGWKAICSIVSKYKFGKAASVGVQGVEATTQTAEHSGMSNVELAVIHEFGTSDDHIPERSFIRSTLTANQAEYQRRIDEIASAALRGISIDGGLFRLGEKVRADIIRAINAGISPPLAESTIERRGGRTTPLFDTGQLRDSITSRVVSEGDVK